MGELDRTELTVEDVRHSKTGYGRKAWSVVFTDKRDAVCLRVFVWARGDGFDYLTARC